ncbi:MAG: hypothetical protein ACRCYY_16400 [Trueperaceae bacterium]
MRFDAEGHYTNEVCPRCGSAQTISYDYNEGFSELECEACGYTSEAPELSDLGRFRGELREGYKQSPIPIKKLKA